MELYHVFGLFLAIFGILAQGVKLTSEPDAIGNRTFAHMLPELPDVFVGGSSTSSVVQAPTPDGWATAIPDHSLHKTQTTSNMNISWSSVTLIETMTATMVINPVTTTKIINKVSTIESTTTRIAEYPSTTKKFTEVVIAGFSTETTYTSTWLAPPEPTTFTLTRKMTSVSEIVIVPTDVTYTLDSVPPTPTSFASIQTLSTLLKRDLSLDPLHSELSAPMDSQHEHSIHIPSATQTDKEYGNRTAESVTLAPFLHTGTTAITPNMSVHWATSNTSSPDAQVTSTGTIAGIFSPAHYNFTTNISLPHTTTAASTITQIITHSIMVTLTEVHDTTTPASMSTSTPAICPTAAPDDENMAVPGGAGASPEVLVTVLLVLAGMMLVII